MNNNLESQSDPQQAADTNAAVPEAGIVTEAGKIAEAKQAVSTVFQIEHWQHDQIVICQDQIIQEQPVALVYNGLSHVVMMLTPHQIEEFVLGFSLSEGIISTPADLYHIELITQENGIEAAIEISSACMHRLKNIRRNLTGRTGCGLCGAESLEQAIRQPLPVASQHKFSHAAVEAAVLSLEARQPLQSTTGAVHGAAWCDAMGNILQVREDVGRHNALDKLYGAIAANRPPQSNGYFILISSRASYEMVQKAAAMGVEMLVAVSAPTKLAIELAEQANITLIGFARPGRQMVYSHPERLYQGSVD
ncbi:MAG: formate dehydrogenase accessory sulfurtransferase FdhD [Pseudomonadales bacterium]|nr:formate dehydrogenase accessory sulfurtransferase FdhD [Pseudomonadales bacterium]